MWRMLLALLTLATPDALTAQTHTLRVKPPFQPPELVSVTFKSVPISCAEPAAVALDAVIIESGDLQKVEVRPETDCLTRVAVQMVRDWKLSAATSAGKPIASRMPVH
jgi:hypothetical protein